MFGFWRSGAGSQRILGSGRRGGPGFGDSPKRTLRRAVIGKTRAGHPSVVSEQSLAASRRQGHASRVRSPEFWGIALLIIANSLGMVRAQDAVNTPETSELVISATRLATPEEETPASVNVITTEDFENKQIQRVADALREVPGLSVVQSGTAGQLTSVFTRGLRSEHTQVLIDGVPINQGLAGLFNFADLTIDNIERIEIVRGPQSTVYGPRALAGVIQVFTKQGGDAPETSASFEGGSYDTFRETLATSGRIRQVDYSLGGSRLDTDNARPNNQYRLWNFVGEHRLVTERQNYGSAVFSLTRWPTREIRTPFSIPNRSIIS